MDQLGWEGEAEPIVRIQELLAAVLQPRSFVLVDGAAGFGRLANGYQRPVGRNGTGGGPSWCSLRSNRPRSAGIGGGLPRQVAPEGDRAAVADDGLVDR
jgi:hypothetical protein